MTEGTKKAIKEKIFRIRATRRTVELKQALTPGERETILDCLDNYVFLLETKPGDTVDLDRGKLVEIPPEVADSGKAIDEHLKQKKEKPNG